MKISRVSFVGTTYHEWWYYSTRAYKIILVQLTKVTNSRLVTARFLLKPTLEKCNLSFARNSSHWNKRSYQCVIMRFRYMEQENRYPLPHPGNVLTHKANLVSSMQTGKALASLHIWVSLEPSSLNKNSCAGSNVVFDTFFANRERYGESIHLLGLIRAFVTVKKSRAGSNGDLMLFCASSECSGESAHLLRLTLAFVNVPKSRDIVLSQNAIFALFAPAVSMGESAHLCRYRHWTRDKYQELMPCQWRLLRVCTFTQTRLSLVTVSKSHVLAQMVI